MMSAPMWGSDQRAGGYPDQRAGGWRGTTDVEAELYSLRTLAESTQRNQSSLENKVINRLDNAVQRQLEDLVSARDGPFKDMKQALSRVHSECHHLQLEFGRLPSATDVDNALERHQTTLEEKVLERLETVERSVSRQHQVAMERLESRGGETWRTCLQRMSSLEDRVVLQADIPRLMEKTLAEVRRVGPELLGDSITSPESVAEVRSALRKLEAKVAGCEARLMGLSEDTNAEARVWRASLAAKVDTLERTHQDFGSRFVAWEQSQTQTVQDIHERAETAEKAAKEADRKATEAETQARKADDIAAQSAKRIVSEMMTRLNDEAQVKHHAVRREIDTLQLNLRTQEQDLESTKEEVATASRQNATVTDSLTALRAELAQLTSRTNASTNAVREHLEKDMKWRLVELRDQLQIKIASDVGELEGLILQLRSGLASNEGRLAMHERRLGDFQVEVARAESRNRGTSASAPMVHNPKSEASVPASTATKSERGRENNEEESLSRQESREGVLVRESSVAFSSPFSSASVVVEGATKPAFEPDSARQDHADVATPTLQTMQTLQTLQLNKSPKSLQKMTKATAAVASNDATPQAVRASERKGTPPTLGPEIGDNFASPTERHSPARPSSKPTDVSLGNVGLSPGEVLGDTTSRLVNDSEANSAVSRPPRMPVPGETSFSQFSPGQILGETSLGDVSAGNGTGTVQRDASRIGEVTTLGDITKISEEPGSQGDSMLRADPALTVPLKDEELESSWDLDDAAGHFKPGTEFPGPLASVTQDVPTQQSPSAVPLEVAPSNSPKTEIVHQPQPGQLVASSASRGNEAPPSSSPTTGSPLAAQAPPAELKQSVSPGGSSYYQEVGGAKSAASSPTKAGPLTPGKAGMRRSPTGKASPHGASPGILEESGSLAGSWDISGSYDDVAMLPDGSTSPSRVGSKDNQPKLATLPEGHEHVAVKGPVGSPNASQTSAIDKSSDSQHAGTARFGIQTSLDSLHAPEASPKSSPNAKSKGVAKVQSPVAVVKPTSPDEAILASQADDNPVLEEDGIADASWDASGSLDAAKSPAGDLPGFESPVKKPSGTSPSTMQPQLKPKTPQPSPKAKAKIGLASALESVREDKQEQHPVAAAKPKGPAVGLSGLGLSQEVYQDDPAEGSAGSWDISGSFDHQATMPDVIPPKQPAKEAAASEKSRVEPKPPPTPPPKKAAALPPQEAKKMPESSRFGIQASLDTFQQQEDGSQSVKDGSQSIKDDDPLEDASWDMSSQSLRSPAAPQVQTLAKSIAQAGQVAPKQAAPAAPAPKPAAPQAPAAAPAPAPKPATAPKPVSQVPAKLTTPPVAQAEGQTTPKHMSAAKKSMMADLGLGDSEDEEEQSFQEEEDFNPNMSASWDND